MTGTPAVVPEEVPSGLLMVLLSHRAVRDGFGKALEILHGTARRHAAGEGSTVLDPDLHPLTFGALSMLSAEYREDMDETNGEPSPAARVAIELLGDTSRCFQLVWDDKRGYTMAVQGISALNDRPSG